MAKKDEKTGVDIETVDIKTLRPYWRNPRRIDDAVESVVDSIQEAGYVSPIAVDSHMVIVVGHARYRALQRLGFEQVDVVKLDHLSESEAHEYRLADNKTAELAGWDESKLMAELLELDDADFARRYFSDKELSQIMGDRLEDLIPAEPEGIEEAPRKHPPEGAAVPPVPKGNRTEDRRVVARTLREPGTTAKAPAGAPVRTARTTWGMPRASGR